MTHRRMDSDNRIKLKSLSSVYVDDVGLALNECKSSAAERGQYGDEHRIPLLLLYIIYDLSVLISELEYTTNTRKTYKLQEA